MTTEAKMLTVIGDDLVADDETGEVIEWPADMPALPSERIAVLQRWAKGAQDSEKASKTAYDLYRRIIGGLLAEAGVSSLTTEQGRALRTADGTQKKAPAPQVASAVEAELLTSTEAMDLLIRAAKELDAEIVDAWLTSIEDEKRRNALRAVLIIKTARTGYVRLYPPAAAKPPKVSRRAQDVDLVPALEQSIAAVNA